MNLAKRGGLLRFRPPNHFMVLIAVQVFLISLQFRRFLPNSNGWFLVWGANAQRRIPYKDFYFPLPPIHLFLGGILPLKFPDPLIAGQVIDSLIWLIFVGSLYGIVRKIGSSTQALFASMVTSAIYFAQPFNIIAGYLEAATAFLMLGIFLILSASGRRAISGYLGGICFGLSIGTKQTFLIPSLAVLLVLLLGNRKHRNGLSASVCLGVLTPAVGILTWSLFVGNTLDMVGQVLSGGGKGTTPWSALSRVIEWGAIDTLSRASLVPCIILGGIAAYEFDVRKPPDDMFEQQRKLVLTVGVSLAMFWLIPTLGSLSGPESNYFLITYMAVLGLTVFRFFMNDTAGTRWDGPRDSIFGLLLAAVLLLGIEVITIDNRWFTIELRDRIAQNLSVGTAFGLLALIALRKRFRRSNLLVGEAQLVGQTGVSPMAVVLVASLALPLANALSGTLTFESWFLGSAILMVFIVRFLEDRSAYFAKLNWVFLLPLVAVVPAAANTTLNDPYNWWGLRYPSLSGTNLRTPEVESFRNFVLPEAYASYYEIIDSAITQVRSTIDTPLFFFGIQNQGLSEAYGVETLTLRCPIIWWDTCPEPELQRTITELEQTKPDVIIWDSPPDWVQTGHEQAFLNGQSSSVRRLQQWIDLMKSTKQYSLLYRIGVPNSPDWTTEVFVKSSLIAT